MRRLLVESMGDQVQGIRLRGDRRNPEPMHVRVVFPGGDVDVVRTDDGEYWVHVRVDDAEAVAAEAADHEGQIVDARLDIRGQHASDAAVGDFNHPQLYHLAVRVGRKGA